MNAWKMPHGSIYIISILSNLMTSTSFSPYHHHSRIQSLSVSDQLNSPHNQHGFQRQDHYPLQAGLDEAQGLRQLWQQEQHHRALSRGQQIHQHFVHRLYSHRLGALPRGGQQVSTSLPESINLHPPKSPPPLTKPNPTPDSKPKHPSKQPTPSSKPPSPPAWRTPP